MLELTWKTAPRTLASVAGFLLFGLLAGSLQLFFENGALYNLTHELRRRQKFCSRQLIDLRAQATR